MRTVLLTGSTGYIGRRLFDRIKADPSFNIRLLIRNPKKFEQDKYPDVEVFSGDTLNKSSLKESLKGVDTAFYLIHAMGNKGNFESADRLSAVNFRDACIDAGVKRIIYLGGLGDKDSASKHLRSRIETGELLSAKPDKIQTIWFRAGVIIGSGSASFEIIRNLVQKLPVMTTPKWVTTKTQAVYINDVISYLVSSINLEYENDLIVDIGSDTVSFEEMLIKCAEIMNLKRKIIKIPFLSPKLSSYWLNFITPVPISIASALIEGLKSETLKLNDNDSKYFPNINPLTYEESVKEALNEISVRQIISTWCDSSGGITCDVPYVEDIAKAVFTDKREKTVEADSADIFNSVCRLGGKNGYFRYNLLWRIRGGFDKLIGGVGMGRGRRDECELRIGDSLDFWRVVDYAPSKRLLLKAEMKVPGEAWLEFRYNDNKLTQTAYFYPRGIFGRLYWYAMIPFHYFIFNNLIDELINRAKGSHKT